MKNRSINMLIVGLLLIAALSVTLMVFIEDTHDKFEERITVNANGKTEAVLEVKDLKLTPSATSEYSINLVCAASGMFDVYLDYEEEKDGGMKNFVNVLIKFDDEIAYSGTLTELLDGNKIVEFVSELKEKEPVIVNIKYEMPYTVGNEAQGTYADFKINLKIVKK